MIQILLLIPLLFLMPKPAQAELPLEDLKLIYGLDSCVDDVLGVKFLCNRQWHLQTAHDDFVLVISQSPKATVAVTKIKTETLSVDALSREQLKRIGEYADGFVMKRIELAGRPALQVEGDLVEEPDTHVVDYYFIQAGYLYGLAMSVSPRESWSRFEELFSLVGSSFEFYATPTTERKEAIDAALEKVKAPDEK